MIWKIGFLLQFVQDLYVQFQSRVKFRTKTRFPAVNYELKFKTGNLFLSEYKIFLDIYIYFLYILKEMDIIIMNRIN